MNLLLEKFALFTTTVFLTATIATNVMAQQSNVSLSGVKVAQLGLVRKLIGLTWLGRASKGATLLSKNGRVFRTSRGSVMGTHNSLRNWIPKNLPGGGDKNYDGRNSHHIIPQEHARVLFPNENLGHMPAVNLPRRDHMDKYHGRLDSEMASIRRRFPDLNNPEARRQTWGAYQRVYAEHPDWLEAISGYFD